MLSNVKDGVRGSIHVMSVTRKSPAFPNHVIKNYLVMLKHYGGPLQIPHIFVLWTQT